MDTIRALGRKHSLVDKQDRIGPLFDVLMTTISRRLCKKVGAEVLIAWRFHFDVLRRAMTRDKIRLYPELHSRRVSSSKSTSNVMTFTVGAPSDDQCGEESCLSSEEPNDPNKVFSRRQRAIGLSKVEQQLANAVFDFDSKFEERIPNPLPNFKFLAVSNELNELSSAPTQKAISLH